MKHIKDFLDGSCDERLWAALAAPAVVALIILLILK